MVKIDIIFSYLGKKLPKIHCMANSTYVLVKKDVYTGVSHLSNQKIFFNNGGIAFEYFWAVYLAKPLEKSI
jgi:hypothetical protein